MHRTGHLVAFTAVVVFTAVACQPQAAPVVTNTPAALQFSGEQALRVETEFVTAFPDRHSGQPNNAAAAGWLLTRFSSAGWTCAIDAWQIVNYSRRVPLNNVVCRLPGASTDEILVTAHLDQAPTTVQGADNDGSGIAILLELARIFASEPRHPFTLAFVATDAEEYGMIGTGRYVETYPSSSRILAAISLDNLGRSYYDGMKVDLVGQFHGYGPIWLALAARESARSAGLDWNVLLRSPIDQALDQAVPVSMMDQGPAVAAGIPALGFAGHTPPELSATEYALWHSPGDTLDRQSADALGQSGLIAEALIRHLMSLQAFPQETGPYIYFDDSGQVLRGPALWLIFAAFVGLFFLGSLLVTRAGFIETVHAWRRALPHFLGLWLPLLASILLLYVFVSLGLMDTYARYPATSKDPLLIHPRWPAVALFLIALACFLYLGRRLVPRFAETIGMPSDADSRSLSLLVIGLAGLYILLANPFSLLFVVPILFWLLMRRRKGLGLALNLLLFALGGLLVYALVYVFGFTVLRIGWYFLWYLMNMFSIGMIDPPTSAVITAIIAAGLAIFVFPPGPRAPVPGLQKTLSPRGL